MENTRVSEIKLEGKFPAFASPYKTADDSDGVLIEQYGQRVVLSAEQEAGLLDWLNARARRARNAKGVLLTERQARAAGAAVSAMLAGMGPGEGDWPEDISDRDMRGAADKLGVR